MTSPICHTNVTHITQAYWAPGNSEMFLDLVERLTGAPLAGDAWVAELTRPLDALLADEASHDVVQKD